MKLDDRQIELYSRQILLRELGGIGQRRLLEARCLLIGDGPGLATIATYLVGGGIGALDLLPTSAGGESDPTLVPSFGFAPLDERRPEAAFRVRGADEPIDLAAFDALVLARSRTPRDEILTSLRRAEGAPRLGALRLEPLASGAIGLVLVPSAADGCLACHAIDDDTADERSPPSPSSDALGDAERDIAERIGGAMAALAILRWAAGIGRDDRARALRLAPGAPAWSERAAGRRLPCPRGCPR